MKEYFISSVQQAIEFMKQGEKLISIGQIDPKVQRRLDYLAKKGEIEKGRQSWVWNGVGPKKTVYWMGR